MVMCSGRNPEWLESWLRTPFYDGEKCETHILKYNTIFCAVCMESPVCDTCWRCQHSKLHQGHLILQVCSSSGRAAIDIREISKYIDVSGIQLYKINGKDILFLNPNGDGSKDHHEHDPKCQTCRRRIKESNYLFCSIACKNYKSVEYKMEKGEQQRIRKRKRKRKMKSTAGEGECSSAMSIRRKSRKGIPRRAPFW